MKNKGLKISVVILLIITLTMTNFIFLGSSLISYAVDDISTNNKNIEFSAYFKNDQGEKVSSLDRTSSTQNISLYLSISVKKEGFFNGQVELTNSNFNIASSESEYVSRIEGNKVYLNQINAGTTAEIELKAKTIENDNIDLNMLSAKSDVTLTGIYRDSTEKDIEINAVKNVVLNLVETNTADSVENSVTVVTNKAIKISGEDKRVIQLSINMGLKENNYPIKEIYEKIAVPEIDGKTPEVLREVNLNTMSAFDYKYENGYVEITLKNDKTEKNTVLWKKQGTENIILTYIYDSDVDLEGSEITSEEKVTLYNNKEITSASGKVTLSNEEIDTTINVSAINSNESIYKGKLYSGIDKQYTSKTTLDVNLANIEEYISIREESSRYISEQGETDANVYYNNTTLSKSSFDSIFGQEGRIEIYNERNELISTITNATEADANGNIVIDYTGNEPKAIEIRTSRPIAEGTIEFNHTKTIRASAINTVKSASNIATKIVYGYNNYEQENMVINGETYTRGIEKEIEISMGLQETATETKFEISRNSMSTIVANDIEMKLVLKTDSEDRDLYRNPTFTIELPEQVESIQINSINLLYEEELKIANYYVEGRNIVIQMEGEQTSYKAQSVEGANIIINATVNVSRTAIANIEKINLTYTNEKANAYANGEEIGRASKDIEITAPKDVTAINRIESLDVETIGQDEEKDVRLERGTDSKQMAIDIEVINNNREDIQNVSILGTFPTRTEENNIDMRVVEEINIENGTVYYTENENATTDLDNPENGWTQEITNPEEVSKYLIKMDSMASSTSVSGSYTVEVPENLEYNQTAKEGYEVTYTKTQANNESQVKATTLSMETGVGPKLETKLVATVAGEQVNNGSIVRNGEVIKYIVQVANTGTVDVTNAKVTGNVPTGTVLVEPVNHYEYTGTSYYKEVEGNPTTYETTIDSLAVGETKYVEYEVMVKSDTADSTALTNKAVVNYVDVSTESEESTLKSATGNLSAVVKRVTDREADVYEQGSIKYYAIIENTSSETMENVMVKTNKSDNTEVGALELITGMKSIEINDDDIIDIDLSDEANTEQSESNTESETQPTESTVNREDIEYSDEINIGTLEPGQTKVLAYYMNIGTIPENTTDIIDFSVVAQEGGREYRSNQWQDEIKSFEIEMSMESNTESKYVKTGDNITYTIKVKNTGTAQTSGITIQDEIPYQLSVTNVTVNGKEQEIEEGEEYPNYIAILNDIPANSEMEIKIETVVDNGERTTAETITNKALTVVSDDVVVAETPEVSHILEADIEENGNNNPGGDNQGQEGGQTGGQTGDVANGDHMISGSAWFDTNADGKKDSGEQSLSEITVKLLNVDTNQLVKDSSGNSLSTTTGQNGMYVLDNIQNGRYIAIFEYDTNQYALTKYKAEGVSDTENSDVSLNELLIGDARQQVASTDIINITDSNVSDISIGLIELQNFDLKLDKYVSKIVVQNSAGTTVREYSNTNTAKIELDAKQMNGSTVIVEYSIIVTNVGEVAGYARNIIDYMPNDLEFSSELNKDWYESNNSLYTTALGNEIINPGESKTVTLTLTKTMGEDNVVSRNNAEIYEDYNDLGLNDSNSTPGNNANGENDMSSADVIISIRTGGVIYMTIGIVLAIIVIAGITAGIIVKRKNSKSEE